MSGFKTYIQKLKSELPKNATLPEKITHYIGVLFFLCSMLMIAFLPIPITADVIARIMGKSIVGIMELEQLLMVLISYLGLGFITATKSHLIIDILTSKFSSNVRLRLAFMTTLLSFGASGLLGIYAFQESLKHEIVTYLLHIPEAPFVLASSLGLLLIAVESLFLVIRYLSELIRTRDWFGIISMLFLALLIVCIPVLYKFFGLRISKLTLGILGFVILFTLLFLEMPIGIAMILVGFIGLFILSRSERAVYGMTALVPFAEGSNFIMTAIPMFMLMGEIVTFSGISRDMFDCAKKWLGHSLPGGLACATITGCAGFGAICGDSLATMITMSGVALPPMRDNGYHPSLACGSLAAGGTIAILIPPSMGFIYYSMMTEVSVGALFMAGFLPGILMACIFMAIIIIRAKNNPSIAPKTAAYPLSAKLRSFTGLIPMLVIFIIVIGGIMEGFFTPGEGGAIGALSSLIYAGFRKTVDIENLLKALHSTAAMTTKVMLIIAGVYVFGAFLTSSRLPSLLAKAVTSSDVSPYVFLLFVVILYLFLGCVMNILPMMMLTLPSLFPTVEALGFNGVWFGILCVILMECGMITPPIGMNVFVMSGLADVPMGTIFKGVLPFFLGMLLTALLVTIFPDLALFIPKITGMV